MGFDSGIAAVILSLGMIVIPVIVSMCYRGHRD